MRRSVLIALGVAAVAGLWIASGQFNENPEADKSHPEELSAEKSNSEQGAVLPRVRVIESQASDHGLELVLFGRSEEDRSIDIRAATNGHVAEIFFDKGSFVEEDSEIVRLRMDDRQARLREAEAEVEYRDLAYEAAQSLAEKQFSPEVTVAGDLAALQTAKAALRVIRLDIARTRIRAPFPGVIDQVPVEIGDYVQIGDVIATVVDIDPIVVATEVTERQVAQVQLGNKAQAEFANGVARIGVVTFISRTASEETRTFRVDIEISNGEFLVPKGITAEVTIFAGSVRSHLISPAIMTLSDDGRLGVKIVTDQQSVAFNPVRIVAETPDGVWVTGLPDSVTLITVGQEFVRAGDRVDAVMVDGS